VDPRSLLSFQQAAQRRRGWLAASADSSEVGFAANCASRSDHFIAANVCCFLNRFARARQGLRRSLGWLARASDNIWRGRGRQPSRAKAGAAADGPAARPRDKCALDPNRARNPGAKILPAAEAAAGRFTTASPACRPSEVQLGASRFGRLHWRPEVRFNRDEKRGRGDTPAQGHERDKARIRKWDGPRASVPVVRPPGRTGVGMMGFDDERVVNALPDVSARPVRHPRRLGDGALPARAGAAKCAGLAACGSLVAGAG
jgi:hypothetical protein